MMKKWNKERRVMLPSFLISEYIAKRIPIIALK